MYAYIEPLLFVLSSIGVAAWRIPIVRASNEGRLRPRVARTQGIGGVPSLFSPLL
jgi:hypothetical protein